MAELNIYQNRNEPTEPMLDVSVEWVTQITENRGGKENRIPKITEPQYTIEGSDFALRDDDYDVFVQAFIDAEGKNNAFPFKCPLDYYCTRIAESYGSGFQIGRLVLIDDGTNLNYQIVKQYTAGGVSTYKTITLPVDGTIHVYLNDVEVFPTVNLSTGVVTFASPPSGTLEIECEFRLPMRFDVDDNQLNQIKRAVNSIYAANDTSIYLAVNFRLVEDMNYVRQAPLGTWNTNLSLDFDGHPLADVAYSERSLTRIQSSDNKRELRDGLGVFRKKYAIANNNMDWVATQKYFNLFMACKGRLLPFTFEGSLVRLDSDIFSASMIGFNNVNLLPPSFICTPNSITFTDSLSSFTNWSFFSEAGSGDWDINAVINSGKWRVTTQFESPPISQIWVSSFNYTPQSADEIITFNFSISAQLISATPSTSGQLFNFFLIQNGSATSGGFQELTSTSPTTLTRSGTLTALGGSLVVGQPIYFAIGFGNSTGSTPAYIRVADYWDFACTIDVTCP